MIAIWDNGLDYSDHEIYFVDIGPFSKDEFLKIWELLQKVSRRDEGFVLGFSQEIEWVGNDLSSSISDWAVNRGGIGDRLKNISEKDVIDLAYLLLKVGKQLKIGSDLVQIVDCTQ